MLFMLPQLKKIKSYVNTIWRLIGQIKLDDSIKSIKDCDILFFCHDVDRGIKLNGVAYSPLIDSIHEDFTRRGLICLSIAHPWSVLTGHRGYGKPISMNRTLLLNRVLNFFSKNKPRINPYSKILEKSNCRLIVTIGAPDDLCLEARRRDIYHVELLHGIGYTTIEWGWSEKKVDYLPQGILALDKISAAAFSPLSKHGITIKEIPHPFLKRFIGNQLSNIPKEWLIKKQPKYKKEILVSLQWGYSGDHGMHIQFANILKNGLFFEELAAIVAEDKDIFWRFRFHPVQLRNQKYEHLLHFMDDFVSKNPNAEWKESSLLPFPSVATHCDGNISMSSMSCYDAAALGVPSLMLCPNVLPGGIHEDFFTDLEEEGFVIKEPISKAQIHSWIQNVEKLPPRVSNLEDDQAWEEAVTWMLSSSGLDSKV